MILAAGDTIRDSLVKDFFFLANSTIHCHFVNRFAGSMSLPVFPDSGSLLATPPFLLRVPVSLVPRSHRYYEGATTSHLRVGGRLFGSLPPTRKWEVVAPS